jgi:hypothetical protein
MEVLSSLPHIITTAEKDWDPSVYNNDIYKLDLIDH